MKRLFEHWMTLLVGANVVLVALLALVMFFDITGSPAGHPDQAAPASAQATIDVMDMGLAHIPTSNNCVLCHEEDGYIGVKPVPGILHPIEGWRRCTVCHTNPELGRIAPGHEGIAEEECLNCHTSGAAGPPITQPHAALHDQACLDCHGGVAHLPSSMASSQEGDCVLCHRPTDLPPPEYPHPADSPLGCRTCHQSIQVGALGVDHAFRSEGTCLLCHEIRWTAGTARPLTPLPVPTAQLPTSAD